MFFFTHCVPSANLHKKISVPSQLRVKKQIYQVTVSFHKQKTSTIRVKNFTVFLRLSSRLSANTAQYHADSLLKRLKKKLEKNYTHVPAFLFTLEPGAHIKTFAAEFILHIIFADRPYPTVCIQPPYIFLKLPKTKHYSNEELKKRIRKKIASYFLPEIKKRAHELNARYFHAQLKAIGFKELTSRWGSCSTMRQRITLANRLLFLPADLLEYVMIHELAHLVVPDHSRNFWHLVSHVDPEYSQKRKQLRVYIV